MVTLSSGFTGRMRAVGVLASLVLAVGLAGCAKSESSGDQAARQINEANNSLRGDWLLVDYRPEVALEPVMAQLLAVQMGRLHVNFDGTVAMVQGVGVQAKRPYRIVESDGHRSKITLYDDTGMSYEVTATQQGNQLIFQAYTAPWRGLGTLQRGAPPL
jgi:hypothetical protein